MRLTLETAKKKKPETRSRRPLQKEDEMSWGHEVWLVTWHMCPGSGDRGGTWAGNDVPDGENRGFRAVCPVLGRQQDETAEGGGSETGGCGVSEQAQRLSGCLKMGDCYLLRAWWQRGKALPLAVGHWG